MHFRPKKHGESVNLQAWIDSRKIAMISKWMELKGTRPRYLSDILKVAINTAVESAIYDGIRLEGTSESRKYLEEKFEACSSDYEPESLHMNLNHAKSIRDLDREEQ